MMMMMMIIVVIMEVMVTTAPDTGRHELRSFLAASSTQNYFLIARMLRFL